MRTLDQYKSVADAVLKLTMKKFEFQCRPGLRQVLSENSRLVIVLSHSTPLSWIPAPCLLTHFACNEGFGHRTPLGIMDRFFFQYPILRELAKYISQSDQPMNFQQTISHFQSLENSDLVVFPEGSNCFFGDPELIQEFRSPRFVEIAIRSGCPILLCVHRGSEAWAKALPVHLLPPDWLEYVPEFLQSRLKRNGIFTIPLWPKPIEKFQMSCELYQPSLKLEDLSSDPEACLAQVQAEAENVRVKMQSIQSQLTGG